MNSSILHKVEFAEVSSTNDLARLYPPGTALIAQSQNQGRGRRGQNWLSLADRGIYLSVRLKLEQNLACLAQRAAYACLLTVKNLGGQALYKWPNDLLTLECQKFGGILIEAIAPGDFIVGIGLNLSAPDPRFGAFPIQQPAQDRILSRLLNELEICFREPSEQVIAFCWSESIHKQRSQFTFLEAEHEEPYRALGLKADGSLLAYDPVLGKEICLTVANGLQVLSG